MALSAWPLRRGSAAPCSSVARPVTNSSRSPPAAKACSPAPRNIDAADVAVGADGRHLAESCCHMAQGLMAFSLSGIV